MAEETTTPVQTVPTEADSVPASPAAAPAAAVPAASHAARKNSPLLPILTVFLIMVGIADAILWGVAGYYFFQNSKSETPAAQDVSAGGAPAQGAASGGEETSDDDEAKREALEAYIRELVKIADLETEVVASQNSVVAENYTDDATLYAEFTGRTLPLCQQLVEKSSAISSDDPEIAELHKIYQDWAKLFLDSITTMISAIDNQDQAGSAQYEKLRDEASQLENRYKQGLQTLAKERGVSLG